jgi:hypothetical protein
MKIKAIDIEVPADMPIKNEGVAYYRLDNGLKEFLELCANKHGILGFEWDSDSPWNFGVILKGPAKQ